MKLLPLHVFVERQHLTADRIPPLRKYGIKSLNVANACREHTTKRRLGTSLLVVAGRYAEFTATEFKTPEFTAPEFPAAEFVTYGRTFSYISIFICKNLTRLCKTIQSSILPPLFREHSW